jgi:pimeloyl-ACP methyl ester carboxylesterase/predicted glycosyltransferase
MRARLRDREGYVESRGTRVFWEEHGAGDRTILLLPPWQIVHSRVFKMQVPYLARHFRVITFDQPGNGRSGRPATGYDHETAVAHALAVLDATGTSRASLLCKSRSAWHGAILAADHPDRVERLVLVAPGLDDAPRGGQHFHTARPAYEGWQRYNAHYFREHFEEFLQFFFDECFPEPHSTKPREDGVAWGRGTTPDILIATVDEYPYHEPLATLLPRVRVPTLILHGDADRIRPLALAERAHAAIPGSTLVVFGGTGHGPGARQPVRTNLLLRDFFQGDRAPARRTWQRALARPKRALFVSSPIGLGHALRDVAIADALRAQRPDVEIHWLAQDPVTRVLEARGETIHPASRHLAGESAHIESEAGEHDLHVFRAWRDMDEILLANFMVLHDVLEAAPYDLVVGDEAWEADYYWHENPELKRAAYVWMTDFVGWIPLAGPGSREAALTADYNAEMIEHVARFPRVRDRAIFVGSVEDVVDLPFGPGLPGIREWTARHYAFPGYVLPFDPAQLADREPLRARLGFHPDERIVLAAVGGSGVGHHLLRKVLAAAPHVRRLAPDARLVVVAGPRIDPAALPVIPGVEVRAFVPDLYAHLAACDLAIVQGGLSTCMELTAAKRPFLYVPLRNHIEQQVHVPHRLGRYGAGVRMDYAETDPEGLAHAVAEGLKRPVLYRDVETGGARRAAELIAPLLGE